MKIIILYIIFFTLAAYAEDDAVLADHKGPCFEDRQKFCKDVSPGDGKIITCMKEYWAELSQSCKYHHMKIKEQMKQTHDACKTDIEKSCKDIKPGEGRIAKCLYEHQKDLSNDCQTQIEKNKAARKK